MADTPMLARRQIRLAVLNALTTANNGADFAGVTIDSPGDWTTPPEVLPAILLRSTGDRKEGIAKSQPSFNTTVTIELEARVSATRADEAQDAIENLCFTIENDILGNDDLARLISQVTSFETITEVTSNGQVHFGAAKMTILFELCEVFDSITQFDTLDNVQIHVDTASPFDAAGTYSNPPFPAAVVPAPRMTGPDGRDEGALNIDLTQ